MILHVLWQLFTLFMISIAMGVIGAFLLLFVGLMIGNKSYYNTDLTDTTFDGTVYGLALFGIAILVHLGLRLGR